MIPQYFAILLVLPVITLLSALANLFGIYFKKKYANKYNTGFVLGTEIIEKVTSAYEFHPQFKLVPFHDPEFAYNFATREIIISQLDLNKKTLKALWLAAGVISLAYLAAKHKTKLLLIIFANRISGLLLFFTILCFFAGFTLLQPWFYLIPLILSKLCSLTTVMITVKSQTKALFLMNKEAAIFSDEMKIVRKIFLLENLQLLLPEILIVRRFSFFFVPVGKHS